MKRGLLYAAGGLFASSLALLLVAGVERAMGYRFWLELGISAASGIAGAGFAAGLGYWLQVRRNPVVRKIERKPAELAQYPLSQLRDVDRALERAKRKGQTLTLNRIPTARWERTLKGAGTAAEAAEAFSEAVGGSLGPRLADNVWTFILPLLRLRFSERTTLAVVDGPRLEAGRAEWLAATVFQDGRGPSMALVLDRTDAQDAIHVLGQVPRVKFVVVSADALRDLLLDEQPTRKLETIISAQVPVADLSPYQTTGGVKTDALFFGRERELRTITGRDLHNFLVVGPRQMGKSTLLQAIERWTKARRDLEAHYVVLGDADLQAHLATHLDPNQPVGAAIPPFRQLAAGDPGRPRLWLIDEVDAFVDADARAGYPTLGTMRALAEEGRAYFILAGFWDLYRAVVFDEKQPLRNFGEQLRIGPLDERAALALVTEPMAALGLSWDSPETTAHLLAQAGLRANLLVLACKGMIESLPRDTRTLTREHLERVLREDPDLRDQGRRWRGEMPLYRAVVRQALLLGRPTREEIREALKARGAVLRGEDFDRALDHRELSYVLVPDGDGRLHCPVPLMQRFIESERSLEAGLAEDLDDLRSGRSAVPVPAG